LQIPLAAVALLLAVPDLAMAGAGGAFEALTIVDAIAIGVIVFVLFRLVSRGFGSRNRQDRQPPQRPEHRRDNVSRFPGRDDSGQRGTEEDREPTTREASEAYRRAQQTWDFLSSKPRSGEEQSARRPGTEPPPVDVGSLPDPGGPPAGVPSGGETSAPSAGTTSARIDVPGFDEEDFLKGAKAVYSRIQESWDARDLEDIRDFVGDQVYENLEQHARRNPTPSRTDILLLNAKLLEVKRDNSDLTASVLYDVLLHKQDATANSKLKEIWHFRKSAGEDAFWTVEGIQQVH
jgi:predicted lipid-binding transport protein (Tim44 family)